MVKRILKYFLEDSNLKYGSSIATTPGSTLYSTTPCLSRHCTHREVVPPPVKLANRPEGFLEIPIHRKGQQCLSSWPQ